MLRDVLPRFCTSPVCATAIASRSPFPPDSPFVRFFYALQRIGAIPCSLNPFAPPDTVVQRAARIRPAFLIAENDELLAAVRGVRALDSSVCLARLTRDAEPAVSIRMRSRFCS